MKKCELKSINDEIRKKLFFNFGLIQSDLDQLWLGPNLISLQTGDQVANTVRLLRSLHVLTFITILSPMAWIHCGLHSLHGTHAATISLMVTVMVLTVMVMNTILPIFNRRMSLAGAISFTVMVPVLPVMASANLP